MEDRLGPVVAALGRVRFVLCRPHNPQNVGAAARALKNAGIARWFLVDPRADDPAEARRLAVHAEDQLARVETVASLPEALSGVALSIGTTVRARAERPLLDPREAVRRLLATRGEVAVVFGDEKGGLTADEVERVDLLSSIPSAAEQPSWNLAQAVAVYAYELRMGALAALAQEPAGRTLADPGALAQVDRALESAAAAAGKPGLRRRLFRTLERAELTAREATLWVAALRAWARRR